MSNKNKRLLKSVCYVSRDPKKTKDLCGNELTVQNTFAYNPESKTSPGTAQRWALSYTNKRTEVPVLTRDNAPFEVTIIDLDVRSEGGRAYRVVDAENRTFDLREDQLIEALKLCGVSPGGKIPGKFVWGVLESSTRMVLVDGDLYKEMVQQEEDKKEKEKSAPKASDLKVGGVYTKPTGFGDNYDHLYLGRVRLPKVKDLCFAFALMPRYGSLWYRNMDDEYIKQAYGPKKPLVFEGDIDTTDFTEFGFRLRDVCKQWKDLTWTQRAEFALVDAPKFERYTPHGPVVVVFKSLPKSLELLGVVDRDLVSKVRDNDLGERSCRYVDAFGTHLVTEIVRERYGSWSTLGVCERVQECGPYGQRAFAKNLVWVEK